jgi:ATP-dependent DNA helicase UvrD/PcrA
MVADPAQSIYGFSGASPRFVEKFAEDFKATRRALSVTFRCGTRIVDLSAKLFVPSRKADGIHRVQSHAVAPGQIAYQEHRTEAGEAKAAVDWAESLCESGVPRKALAPKESPEITPEQIAILGRSRIHLKAVLAELDLRGISYHFSAGESGLFDTAEFKAIFNALKSLANPRDIVSAKTLAAAVSEFAQTDSATERADDDDLIPEKLLPTLAGMTMGTTLETPMLLLAEAATSEQTISDCLEALRKWTPASGDEELDELLRGDQDLLTERWMHYKAVVDRKGRNWQGLVMEILNRPRPETEGYRVLTVHAAKGLEFRAVAILGLNEGSFPDFRNSDGDALESEQRLAYVGVTRASRVLLLSRPLYRRTRYGQRAQEKSRFLEMIGF